MKLRDTQSQLSKVGLGLLEHMARQRREEQGSRSSAPLAVRRGRDVVVCWFFCRTIAPGFTTDRDTRYAICGACSGGRLRRVATAEKALTRTLSSLSGATSLLFCSPPSVS